jgi:hypothetical protein
MEGIFALGCPDWACYLAGRGLWLQVGGILLYVMSHLLMSTIWEMIPFQHLSHNSWPLCFLTPHLVPINIYLCSLVIFVRVLTTKVTESCPFKSWFMLGLTMDSHVRTRPSPPCRWLTFISPDGCQGHLGRQWPNYNLSFLVAQQQYPLLTFLVLFNLSALPQQDSASQETTGDQEQRNNSPALVTTGSWLVYTWQKPEESTLQREN